MAANRGDADTIDVERLASSIKVSMSKYDLFVSPNRSIFKTPIALSRHNKNAYIPNAFSIGPLHHGRPKLKTAETIKAKYLQGLISRSPDPNAMLKDLINSVNALEREAREYYAELIRYSREEFLKILVIDGCFIIELFCRFVYEDLRAENDPIFSMAGMVEVLDHDLILLENQVPWMVLEHLFRKIMVPKSDTALSQFAIAFFRNILAFPPIGRSDHLRDIKHIPDLFKKWLVSSIKVDEEKKLLSQWELVSSATRLAEAGIKFRRSKSSNILEIKFENGVLEIPLIKIHEHTETFFRNLISFEQCYPNSDAIITSYAILLDNLINTAKDVEILCENKILNNWLNPEDAVKFFNKLYHDTYVDHYYYKNLCQEVNSFCQRRWPRWRAVLVRNYFNTPWAVLSTLAAITLLILSILQTFYTIKS
ncbi:UPF0481 protein At3g47200-like [Corylus avellana]|uniref:UPF0481 protein At3g47200-like n=1 Tax=Corylus avellana TaxID=13451 RepID=UPI001E21F24E|nr:UPF0481 protein At3g47200-like [Corylus avellana]